MALAGGSTSDTSTMPSYESNERSSASDDDTSHVLLRALNIPLPHSRDETDELSPKPKLTLSDLLTIEHTPSAKVTRLLSLAKKQNPQVDGALLLSSSIASLQNNGQPASSITIDRYELKAACVKIVTTYFLEPLKEEAAAAIASATAASSSAPAASSGTNLHSSPQQPHSPERQTPPRSRYDTLLFLERIGTIGRFIHFLLELQACSKDDYRDDSPGPLAKTLTQRITSALSEVAQEEAAFHEENYYNYYSHRVDAADLDARDARDANNMYWEKDCRELPKERFNIGMIVMMVSGTLQPFCTYHKQHPFQMQLSQSLVDLAKLYGASYNSTPTLLLPSVLVQRTILSFATLVRCRLQPLLEYVTYYVKRKGDVMHQDGAQDVLREKAPDYMAAFFVLPTAVADDAIDGGNGQIRERRDLGGIDPAVPDSTIPVLVTRLGLAKLVESAAKIYGKWAVPVESAATETALSTWLDTQVKMSHHAVLWSIVRCEGLRNDGLSKIDDAYEKAVAEASFYLGKATILSKFLEKTLSAVSVDWSSEVNNDALTSVIEELLLRSLPAAVVKSDAVFTPRAAKLNRRQLLGQPLQVIFKVLLRIEIGYRPEIRERLPTSCPTCCFHRLLASWMHRSDSQHPLARQMLLMLLQGRCELTLRLANGTQERCPFLTLMASLLFHRQTGLALRRAISSLFLRLLRWLRHRHIHTLLREVLVDHLSKNVERDVRTALLETPTISSLDDERHFAAISAVVVELETRDETKTLVYGHRMQQILCATWDQDETECWWSVKSTKLYQCRVYLSNGNRCTSERDLEAAIQLMMEIADGKTKEYSNAADRSLFELIRLLGVFGTFVAEWTPRLLEQLGVCFRATFAGKNWAMHEDALTSFIKFYRFVPTQHQILVQSWVPDHAKNSFQCRLSEKDPFRREATFPGTKLVRCHRSLLSTSEPGSIAKPSLPADITDAEAVAINRDAVLRYELAKQQSTAGDDSDNLVWSEIDLLCARSDRLAVLRHVAASAGSKVFHGASTRGMPDIIGVQLDEECTSSELCQQAEVELPRSVRSQFGLLLLGQVSSAELFFQKYDCCCRQPHLMISVGKRPGTTSVETSAKRRR